MSNAIVVASSRDDVRLLRKLLGRAEDLSLRFFAAEGMLSPVSLARNVLVHEGGPVLLVLDAGTTDPEGAWNAAGLAEVALGNVAGAAPFEVIAFRPELDILFFERPGVLSRAFGSASITEALLDRGGLAPASTLHSLLEQRGRTRAEFLASLDGEALDDLARGEQASRLLHSIENLTQRVG